jgi:predicted RNA binding protein YcfA (HicA-like mRNA interferase family)
MSKRDKLRRKLKNNPRNVKFSQIETLLLRFGFLLARVQGSHHVFVEETHQITIVIPVHHNTVKAQYVKDAVEILDALFPATEENNDDTVDIEGDEDDQND